jgi:hypothetical protein
VCGAPQHLQHTHTASSHIHNNCSTLTPPHPTSTTTATHSHRLIPHPQQLQHAHTHRLISDHPTSTSISKPHSSVVNVVLTCSPAPRSLAPAAAMLFSPRLPMLTYKHWLRGALSQPPATATETQLQLHPQPHPHLHPHPSLTPASKVLCSLAAPHPGPARLQHQYC